MRDDYYQVHDTAVMYIPSTLRGLDFQNQVLDKDNRDDISKLTFILLSITLPTSTAKGSQMVD